VYERILESKFSSKDKARNLLSAIKDVIGTEENCFRTVVSILKEIFGNQDKLVADLVDQYLKYSSQPPPPKRPKLRRVSSDPTIQLIANGADSPKIDSARRYIVLPEVRVIQLFTPELILALTGSVGSASDMCLAKGIISDSLHRKLLECTSSEDKVRRLLQCTRSTINVDKRSYRLFLSILESTVPAAVKETLLSAIKEKYEELSKATDYLNVGVVAGDHLVKEFESEESDASTNFRVMVDQFKEAVKEHARACVEKEMLEKELEKKQEENEELKKELEIALIAGGSDDENIRKLRERIAAYESEIKKMKESIAELDKKIEEYRMNEKREESYTQEEYRDIADSQREAQQAESESTAKIQDLTNDIQTLKVSNERLEASVKEFELVNDHFHSQLHSRHCQCLKGGMTAFIAKYIKN
jgi:phage shock protein A